MVERRYKGDLIEGLRFAVAEIEADRLPPIEEQGAILDAADEIGRLEAKNEKCLIALCRLAWGAGTPSAIVGEIMMEAGVTPEEARCALAEIGGD